LEVKPLVRVADVPDSLAVITWYTVVVPTVKLHAVGGRIFSVAAPRILSDRLSSCTHCRPFAGNSKHFSFSSILILPLRSGYFKLCFFYVVSDLEISGVARLKFKRK